MSTTAFALCAPLPSRLRECLSLRSFRYPELEIRLRNFAKSGHKMSKKGARLAEFKELKEQLSTPRPQQADGAARPQLLSRPLAPHPVQSQSRLLCFCLPSRFGYAGFLNLARLRSHRHVCEPDKPGAAGRAGPGPACPAAD